MNTIPFWLISYRYTNQNGNTPRSTSEKILGHSSEFRRFQVISVNTGRNERFGRNEFSSLKPKMTSDWREEEGEKKRKKKKRERELKTSALHAPDA